MSDDEEHLEDFVELEQGTLIRDAWAVVRELGKGAYGHVYHVLNIKTGVQAALKAESKLQADRVLKMERNVLQGFKGVRGAVQLISMGTNDSYSYIIMTLCGADLSRICKTIGSLTDGTILRLAIRTLLSLKKLHEIGFVHRDVKPCNFAVSVSSPRVIHVIDFGMTRKYAMKNEKSEWCIKRKRTRVAFRGSLRYCSISVHHRLEQGRVDDLWSWAYMTIEMRDPLPWAKVSHPEAVQGLKEDTPLEKLCGTTGPSRVFLPIMKQLGKLDYFDRPDYKAIFELILAEVMKLKVNITDPYDWDGKLSDPDAIEKLNEVCERNGVKFDNLPKQELSCEATEATELEYLRQEFSPSPSDVPGGVQYEEKKRAAKSVAHGHHISGADLVATAELAFHGASDGKSKHDTATAKMPSSRRNSPKRHKASKEKEYQVTESTR